MKHKLFTLFLALEASVGTLFSSVTIGGIAYNLNEIAQTAEVTFSEIYGYSESIIIPSSVEYNSVIYSVTSIGERAFGGVRDLTSVTIPNSVTSIGVRAFCATSMTSVTIPNSVTSIGEQAFSATSLTSVTIPNSVISIGFQAFAECSSLTSIIVENGNSVYDSRNNCNAIIETATNTLITGCQNTIIPNNVTSIGSAFYGCTGLTSVIIPNSVISIGWEAFAECSGLTSITIPNSVTRIERYAFWRCTGLTSLVVENGNIVYDSRNNCNAIIETATNTLITGCQNTIIPNSVTSIGDYAFDCSSLKSVTIGNRVTSIGDNAFAYCRGLKSVTIPNSVTSIGDYVFIGCTGLTSVIIPNSVTSIGDGAFRDCSGLKSVTIPNSVTSIGEDAFRGCSGLTSVTIPNSVTSIGELAFLGCTGLTSITCNAEVPPICGEDAFYEVDKSIPIYVPGNSVYAYKKANEWKEFGDNIQPIQAEESSVTEIEAEPTDNSVFIQWPTISWAYTYELVIKDKNGNVVYTLLFNEQGQLLSIAFNKAPKRINAPQQTQTAGFAFTVTGLDSGTRYTATITAKASNGSILNTKTVSFTTTGQTQGVDQITNGELPRGSKLIKNGQLFIQRGDEIFNAQGARVK